jgi:hypothetical protein
MMAAPTESTTYRSAIDRRRRHQVRSGQGSGTAGHDRARGCRRRPCRDRSTRRRRRLTGPAAATPRTGRGLCAPAHSPSLATASTSFHGTRHLPSAASRSCTRAFAPAPWPTAWHVLLLHACMHRDSVARARQL